LPGGEISFVNDAYCNYFEQSFDELVGSNFLSLIPVTDQKTVLDNISALTPDSPTQSHEHAVISPNGDIRWQRWINRAIFDGRGKVVEYQAIGEDISKRKHLRPT
jgi:two-component system cell cycle sensor histidine kinase/response regulator CckA